MHSPVLVLRSTERWPPETRSGAAVRWKTHWGVAVVDIALLALCSDAVGLLDVAGAGGVSLGVRFSNLGDQSAVAQSSDSLLGVHYLNLMNRNVEHPIFIVVVATFPV